MRLLTLQAEHQAPTAEGPAQHSTTKQQVHVSTAAWDEAADTPSCTPTSNSRGARPSSADKKSSTEQEQSNLSMQQLISIAACDEAADIAACTSSSNSRRNGKTLCWSTQQKQILNAMKGRHQNAKTLPAA
jgi:hypothetical protein